MAPILALIFLFYGLDNFATVYLSTLDWERPRHPILIILSYCHCRDRGLVRQRHSLFDPFLSKIFIAIQYRYLRSQFSFVYLSGQMCQVVFYLIYLKLKTF